MYLNSNLFEFTQPQGQLYRLLITKSLRGLETELAIQSYGINPDNIKMTVETQ